MNETKPHGHSGLETLPEVHLTHSPSIGALAAALAKAQSVTESAPKNHTAEVTMKSGGKYRYSYADLAGVWDAVRAPLSANGLAAVQAWTLRPDGLAMTTLLAHSSGEWVRGEMAGFPVPDRTPQGVGTSVTYARRYTLGAMTGAVSEEDDDGGNGGRPKARTEKAEPRDDAPRSAATGPTTLPNYGPAKGAPIRDAPPHVLDKYLEDARKELADPSKAKFHGKASALIGALEAELKRQGGAVPEGQRETKAPAPTNHYEALAMKATTVAMPPQVLRKWLGGNGLVKKSDVTEAMLASFVAYADEWKIKQIPPPGVDDAPF